MSKFCFQFKKASKRTNVLFSNHQGAALNIARKNKNMGAKIALF